MQADSLDQPVSTSMVLQLNKLFLFSHSLSSFLNTAICKTSAERRINTISLQPSGWTVCEKEKLTWTNGMDVIELAFIAFPKDGMRELTYTQLSFNYCRVTQGRGPERKVISFNNVATKIL
ncbi:hypothetical protein NPIL_607581 [Nephila pilipes]|uniref:Uncharacterized protein n=1 Tax=Nephila pilipes TaxID=299642 RepID=A0A8X6I2F3_NEPPI|nr:hypothetical protein NPIL_607581 [Nephila pilipes]